jgi:exopolysaccharide production protein ExoQ
MSPTLALALCVCFVVVLLRLERQRSPGLTLSVWVPTLWMLYCASRPISYWFSSATLIDGEMEATAGNPIERLFLTTLIALGVLILLRRSIDWAGVTRNNGWLLLLFCYMLLSVAWSDYSAISLRRWIRASGTIIMALVVMSEPSPRLAFESILRRSVYILIPFSLLLIKYFPEFGVSFGRWSGERMWVGVAAQKNGLGRLCLVSAFFLIWVFIRRWRGEERHLSRSHVRADLVMLGMTFWLMRGPGGTAFSATSVSALILGLGTLVGVLRMKGPLRSFELWVLTGAAVYVMGNWATQIIFDQSIFHVILAALGRDPTLTGRTEIWAELLEIAWKQPVLGLGYGSFWIDPPISFDINQGHNGYIDVFLELGAVGIVLLVLFLFSLYRKARNALEIDKEWGAFVLSFLVMSVFYNFTESAFLGATSHLWVMLAFLAVVFPASIRASERELEEILTDAQSPCPKAGHGAAQDVSWRRSIMHPGNL